MAVRPVIQLDNPVLRQKAKRVRAFDAKLHQLLDDMLETLEHEQGVGLAAPQIAVSQRVIIVVLPDDKEEYGDQAGAFYEVVNPEIVKISRDMVEGIEGCLSIPGNFGLVDRADSVVVQGFNRKGKEIRIKAYDWLARVFQHEIDHLDGVLYTDKAKEVWKAGEEPEWLREQYKTSNDDLPLAEDPPA